MRRQQWNVTSRAGEDFKLALTIYDENGEPALVRGSRSRMVLVSDRDGLLSRDYGFVYSAGRHAAAKVDGYQPPKRPGGVNFVLTPSQTAGLQAGRYRLAIQVDLLDGSYTQVEGILQVREFAAAGFGHLTSFFQLDRSMLDGDEPLADELAENGLPVDGDGFFMLGAGFMPGGTRPDREYWSSILGIGLVRWMVLGDEPEGSILGLYAGAHLILAPSDEDTSIIGTALGEHMIVGSELIPPVDPDPFEGAALLGFGDGAPLLGFDDDAPLVIFEEP